MFDPSDPDQRRFDGYGRFEGPEDRDRELTAFVDDLVSGGPGAVTSAMAAISTDGQQVLRTYAVRIASMADRGRGRRSLLNALIASVVGGLDEKRPETQTAMEPIDHAAERIGFDISDLLDEASKIVGPPRTINMIMCLRGASARRRAPATQLAATRYEAVFDPTDPKPARYDGYGRTQIPNRRDDEITDFINDITTGSGAVSKTIATITESGREVLQVYAHRMASLAVRIEDRAILLNALVANVIGGLDTNRHESLRIMSLIDDAATRIGVDLQELCNEVSAIVGQPGSDSLMLWLSRGPELRTLESMHYAVSEDVDGFRYERY